MGIVGNMENKLFLLGIDVPLERIIKLIGATPEIEEKVLHHFYIFEFNQDTKTYQMWNMLNTEKHFKIQTENEMFDKMDTDGINFIGDIPLGNIFKSYTATYLELVRWTADIYYAKRHWEGLTKE